MRLPRPALTAALLLLLAGADPPLARAQDTLEAAMGLYASAAYDEALTMLDRVPVDGADATARVSIDHYRMLCLLALGRTAEAEAMITSLLEVHPTYRISEGDTSPRVMKIFLDARRRALPAVARRRYAQARTLYAARNYAGAATEFAVVRALLADADLAVRDPGLVDLGQLAAGFEDLSRAEVAAETRRAAEAAAAAAAAEEKRAAERAEAARLATAPPPSPPPPPPPPEPADGIYTLDDDGVVAPVPIRQEIRRWLGPLPQPLAGTPLGLVSFVVDETGAVAQMDVLASVSGFYDAVLRDSLKDWRYQPATKAGRPVKFRRVLQVLSR